jgi:SAM-dependent methyltransferase
MQNLKIYLERQNHHPGLLGIFTNPFFLARRGLYRAIRAHASTLQGRLLDIGCGTQPYRHLFAHTTGYTGVELDTPVNHQRKIAEVFYDGKTLPFAAEEFDSVLCNQVLEHVFEPIAFLAEIQRVLKPGGKLLLSVPFVWDEHEQPYDYARYSSFGLAYRLNQAGFEVVYSEKICANLSILCQLFNAYWYKRLPRRPKGIILLWTVFLMSPVSLIGLLLEYLLPVNPDLYLDNLVVARKIR